MKQERPAAPHSHAPPQYQPAPSAAMMRDGQLWHVPAGARLQPIHTLAELAELPAFVASARRAQPGIAVCGIVSYQAGLVLQGIEAPASAQPLAVLALFDEGEAQAVAPATAEDDFRLGGRFTSNTPASAYRAAIEAIHAYEKAGDCYQVNFAQRLSAGFSGSAWAAFTHLLGEHPAPWASFFQWAPDQAVFGVSPECFFRVHGNRIITEPIKGSRPRGATAREDQALAQDLAQSPKDRAENLMIVDLLRNDLGRVCLPGSVQATPLFELRRFSNVQHLVSTVTGTLRPDTSAVEALLSAFPGGSITGAPKIRAMEIIQELEASPRDFYCGSQFWLDSHGNMDANILIRSFQLQGEQLHCHGGGGIVTDSQADAEYRESLFKVQRLMETLEKASTPG